MKAQQERVLKFISIFQSPSNIKLFTESACYYFSSIMRDRFPSSKLMYNPHIIHFAVEISGELYDITGSIVDKSEYISWDDYTESNESEAEEILYNCMNLERR